MMEVDRISKREQHLRNILTRIVAEPDLKNVLDLILKSGVEFLNMDSGGIILYHKEEPEKISHFSAVNIPIPYATRILKEKEGLISQSISQKKLIILQDFTADTPLIKIWYALGFKIIIVAPLIYQNELVGLMHLGSTNPQRRIDPFEKESIQIYTEYAGLAIYNAQLLDELKKHRNHLEDLATNRTAELKKRNMELQQEIGERKKAEDKLKESEKRFKDIAFSVGDWIWEVDEKGSYIYCSEKVEDILGYTKEEIIGKTPFDLISSEEAKRIGEIFSSILKNKEPLRGLENWNITKDGKRVCLFTSGVPILDDQGNLKGYRGVDKDITDRKRVEDEIRRSYDVQNVLNHLLNLQLKKFSLEDILDQTLQRILNIPWLSFESQGSIFLAEKDSEHLVMKTQKGLAQQIISQCSKIKFGQCLCGLAASSGKMQFSERFNDSHVIKYEGIRDHGHYCVPIISSKSSALGVINIYLKLGHQRDKKEEDFLNTIAHLLAGIIERKQTEEEKENLQVQLAQSEKMAGIGQLASGVAHEINNPLGVILGFAQSMAQRIKEDTPFFMPLKSIEREAQRCKKLVQDLLTFSRTSKTEKEECDINSVIESALSLVEAQTKMKVIIMEKNLQIDLPKIMINGNQIQQVIINLCNNAMDAMPKGGTLRVITKLQTHSFLPLSKGEHTGGVAPAKQHSNEVSGVKRSSPRSEAEWGSSFRKGVQSSIEIAITDTGMGIPEEIKNKIFNPFFTTKEVGGTGLGLSLVYEIVQKHGGTIEFESEVGKGTMFHVFLPINSV